MVEFNIIEKSESYDEYYEDYPIFVELYNDKSITVKDIKKELNLSKSKYKNYLNKALDDGDVSSRDTHTNPTYYTKYKNRYVVYHWDKNSSSLVYFGVYRREVHARRVVEELKKVDWNKSCLKRIKQELRIFY